MDISNSVNLFAFSYFLFWTTTEMRLIIVSLKINLKALFKFIYLKQSFIYYRLHSNPASISHVVGWQACLPCWRLSHSLMNARQAVNLLKCGSRATCKSSISCFFLLINTFSCMHATYSSSLWFLFVVFNCFTFIHLTCMSILPACTYGHRVHAYTWVWATV